MSIVLTGAVLTLFAVVAWCLRTGRYRYGAAAAVSALLLALLNLYWATSGVAGSAG